MPSGWTLIFILALLCPATTTTFTPTPSTTIIRSNHRHQGTRIHLPNPTTTFYIRPTTCSISVTKKSTSSATTIVSMKGNNNETPRISISDAFEGGNIEAVGISEPNGNEITVELRIKQDPYTVLEQVHHFQYFAFRSTVSGLPHAGSTGEKKKLQVNFVIQNAGEVSYPQAWLGLSVCYSSSLEEDTQHNWSRNTGTRYNQEKKVLTWTHYYDKNGSIYFAYFPPFSYQRHLNLIAKCAQSPLANVESLGHTLDGREIDLVKVGRGERIAWIIHRQHPGETMAEYFAEGLLTRLLGLDKQGEIDGNVHKLMEMYTLFIVPCMCVDGAVRGHLRTNACGANLNREWATIKEDYPAPTLDRSPEVYFVLKKMDRHRPDVFLDIHGDEELPVNFLSGAQSTPNWGKRLESLHGAFLAAFTRSNSDMQQHVGYTPVDPSTVVINTATKVVATRFNCFASTLEMPFKDCASNPDRERGWTPNRARLLGASILEPLIYIQPYLRAEGEWWSDLLKEDAYIRPEHREFKYGNDNEVLDL